MIKGCPVAILVASVEHPSQLLRFTPHLPITLPATSRCSLASDSWLSIPQVIVMFIRLTCGMHHITEPVYICLLLCKISFFSGTAGRAPPTMGRAAGF